MANTHLSLKEFNTLYPNKTITDYAKYNWLGGGITPPIPSVDYYLDFRTEDVYNQLVNAAPWIASEEHTDFTLYRRADNFTQVLSHEPNGTILSTTGTAKTDRYGLTMTGSSSLNDKFSYFIAFTLNWTGQPVESTRRNLLSWFIGDNPTASDHTRVSIFTINGETSISLETITTEGSTSKTVVYEAPYDIMLGAIHMTIKWDRTNHTIELLFHNHSVGTFPYYGGPLGYATIAGTSQAPYKPETSLLIRDIEIGEGEIDK